MKNMNTINNFEQVCFLNSNTQIKTKFPKDYQTFDWLLGLSTKRENLVEKPYFKSLEKLLNNKKKWLLGYLGYDLKNEIENLSSKNEDKFGFENMHFFEPELLIISKNDQTHILKNDLNYSSNKIQELLKQINSKTVSSIFKNSKSQQLSPKPNFTKKEYLKKVKSIQKLIKQGIVYELNFCQEFFIENIDIEPFETYKLLNQISPTPFSSFFKTGKKYAFCASPERFLKKESNKLLAQPIKGTIKRGTNKRTDERLKIQLKNDLKEKAENVMIVDLVRNDLAKSSKAGTVKVTELFGIYEFPQVHQMISSIESEILEGISIVDILKNTFPMGSMTGAPKIKVMEKIDALETIKRGIYSGAMGFISPEQNFEFNVFIRGILYDKSKKYLSFQVGGAITYDSIPEQEYEECLLKAKAIKSLFFRDLTQ